MKKVLITSKQVAEAKKLYEFGALNGSITRGEGNLAGALGEILFRDNFEGATLEKSFEFDVLYKGFKVEVKTKRTKVPPQPSFNCSVSNQNTKQACDYYFFIRVTNDYKIGWLLGGIKKIKFYEQAIFNKKGTVDYIDRNGNEWYFKEDCWNLVISKLTQCK